MKPEIKELIGRIESEINRTPTGDLRNLLCDTNIAIQQLSMFGIGDLVESEIKEAISAAISKIKNNN